MCETWGASVTTLHQMSPLCLFQVKKAFFALVYNGVRAAPLWDSKSQDFVGKNISLYSFLLRHLALVIDQTLPGDQIIMHIVNWVQRST